jgi:hypothetical protein
VSHRITCPHCSAPLRLPDGFLPAFAACPRCQGKVPNPELPDDIEITDSGGVPALALDDDVDPEAQPFWHGLRYRVLLLLLVFLCGGLTGLLDSPPGSIVGGTIPLAGVLIALVGIGTALILPIVVRIPRSDVVRQAPPGWFGRAFMVLVICIYLSALWLVVVIVTSFAFALGWSLGNALP